MHLSFGIFTGGWKELVKARMCFCVSSSCSLRGVWVTELVIVPPEVEIQGEKIIV